MPASSGAKVLVLELPEPQRRIAELGATRDKIAHACRTVEFTYRGKLVELLEVQRQLEELRARREALEEHEAKLTHELNQAIEEQRRVDERW